jgi:hypothetical protein
MAGSSGYVYVVRLAPTAITTAKTLLQIKAGAAPVDILDWRLYQITKITTELLAVQMLRKSAAATVTSFTPLKYNTLDPAALAVGGASATGTNASAEGTDTDIVWESVWNVLNGEFNYLDIPEGRMRIPQAGIGGIKLNTAPAASMTVGGYVRFIEYG